MISLCMPSVAEIGALSSDGKYNYATAPLWFCPCLELYLCACTKLLQSEQHKPNLVEIQKLRIYLSKYSKGPDVVVPEHA